MSFQPIIFISALIRYKVGKVFIALISETQESED